MICENCLINTVSHQDIKLCSKHELTDELIHLFLTVDTPGCNCTDCDEIRDRKVKLQEKINWLMYR